MMRMEDCEGSIPEAKAEAVASVLGSLQMLIRTS